MRTFALVYLSVLCCVLTGCSKDTDKNTGIRSDGEGQVILETVPVFASRHCRLKFRFVVGASGLATNGAVLFHVSPYWGWTPPQTELSNAPGFTKVTFEGQRSVDLTIESGKLPYLLIRLSRGQAIEGDQIVIVYGESESGAGSARADRFAESEQEFVFKTDADGDGEFKEINIQPKIKVMANPMTELLITCPSEVLIGQNLEVLISPLDSAKNWDQNWSGKVYVQCTDEFTPRKLEMEITDTASRRFRVKALKKGIGFFTVAFGDEKKSFRSNPVRILENSPEYILFWGDIHGHSVLSDGTGTPEDYYEYARWVSGLDFAALTDHDSWGFRPLSEVWEFYREECSRFNQPGQFVTLLGYEWTQWKDGHRNIIYRTSGGGMFDHRDERYNTPEKLCSMLHPDDSMVIPHHLGGGPVMNDILFDDPGLIPVAEVSSVHGISENYGVDGMIYNAVRGYFYRDALNIGRHWGSMASSDSHDGHPGLRTHGIQTRGVVAVRAAELTRDAVFRAIKDRRCYATTGARIIMDFSVNDLTMGQTGNVKPDKPRRIKGYIVGEDDLEKVVVVKNGLEIKSFYGERSITSLDWIDDTNSQPEDYYYLKILQMNGEMAISSPVWLKTETR